MIIMINLKLGAGGGVFMPQHDSIQRHLTRVLEFHRGPHPVKYLKVPMMLYPK